MRIFFQALLALYQLYQNVIISAEISDQTNPPQTHYHVKVKLFTAFVTSIPNEKVLAVWFVPLVIKTEALLYSQEQDEIFPQVS